MGAETQEFHSMKLDDKQIYNVKLKVKMVDDTKKGLRYFQVQSTLSSGEEGAAVILSGFPVRSPKGDCNVDSQVILKSNSPYILKDYYLVEQSDRIWLLARGFEHSVQSWLESCKGKRWDEIEEQFRSIFRSITRGMIVLHDISCGHGNLQEGIGITHDYKAKLFGMVPKDTLKSTLKADGDQLKMLITQVLNVVGMEYSQLPTRDLRDLYDNLQFASNWLGPQFRWQLDIPYFKTSTERIKFVRLIHERSKRLQSFPLTCLTDHMESYMGCTWKDALEGPNDPLSVGFRTIAAGTSRICAFGDRLHDLVFFVIYIYTHYNEEHKNDPTKFQSIHALEGKVATCFPDFMGALRSALAKTYTVEPDRWEVLEKFLSIEKVKELT